MKRAWIAGLVAAALCGWTTIASAGPVILAGHDTDSHGFTTVYDDLFQELFDNVTNGGSGILAIGADDPSTAGSWIEAVAALVDVDPITLGIQAPSVTFVNGAAISGIDFSSYAVLHIPSDSANTGGGITGAENAFLTARADDVAAFVNGGGGLFGLTQGALADDYGYITGAGGLGAITTLFVSPSGFLPSGDLYDDVSATTEGEALGLSDTNVDGCCWHNVFTSFPSFFDVLAVAEAPDSDDAAFDQVASVIGGASVHIEPPVGVIPEPSSMLLFGLGGLGAGVIRRRRKLNKV
ncbi:MAG: PEP-CTERM sorting domain-containing protein [Candidatus Omnitrophota bacterium]|nr:PEP-CTERM sorting domain-containing protein [Candidatus Omnitrophota bacterium]